MGILRIIENTISLDFDQNISTKLTLTAAVPNTYTAKRKLGNTKPLQFDVEFMANVRKWSVSATKLFLTKIWTARNTNQNI